MDIAYLVLAHTDPDLLACLCKELSKSGDVYIHINKKVLDEPFRDKIYGQDLGERVYILPNRFKICWGGYSILRATFSLLECALQKKQYDRVVLLTGQDYPIVSSGEILSFFESHRDIDFVYGDLNYPQITELYRQIDYRDIRWVHGLIAIVRRIIPNKYLKVKPKFFKVNGQSYPVYGISPKWSVCGDTAKKFLSFYKSNKAFNRYFKYMHAPDDYYAATTIRIFTPIESISIEPIFFEKGRKILTNEDYHDIKSSKCLFARKFGYKESTELISRLQ